MNGKDFYSILGVKRNATEKEIKQAYRRLARKHHPDVNPHDKGAESKFKEISEAYEVLSDPQKKSQYDQFGQTGQPGQQARDPGGFTYTVGRGFDVGDMGDIFENLFGGSARRTSGARAARAEQDVSYPMELTLQEAYSGVTRAINITVPEPCSTCGGSGAAPGAIQTCSSCDGSGRSTGKKGIFNLSGVCEECGGGGRIITRHCDTCHGAGNVPRSRRLEVKIPAGVAEGQRIRAAGQGPCGGDVFLVAHLKPDHFFSRKEDDIWCEVPITFTEAALGAEIEIPTLHGRVKVSVPPGTSSGQALRLAGQGFPHLKGKGRGDQYMKLRIVAPKALNAEEQELMQRLAHLRQDNPRKGRPFAT